eukprot:CAMPEP_0179458260 /NCGR_PEP_ID=MMETSP0799-20121207/41861_1 /TAXON_ID=46947 /ORGANISM="Geminigera cryophila, Strain CCMP2564" /LENGTH=108 /DNA_ID=CAMNT_0021259435 /DNA_START=720 /DNA_END=1047 /DNA_ORIENTATION=-
MMQTVNPTQQMLLAPALFLFFLHSFGKSLLDARRESEAQDMQDATLHTPSTSASFPSRRNSSGPHDITARGEKVVQFGLSHDFASEIALHVFKRKGPLSGVVLHPHGG